MSTKEENQLINKLIGTGGLANVAGGIFVATAYIAHPPGASPAIVSSALWFAVHIGFMVSLLGGILLYLLSWLPILEMAGALSE